MMLLGMTQDAVNDNRLMSYVLRGFSEDRNMHTLDGSSLVDVLQSQFGIYVSFSARRIDGERSVYVFFDRFGFFDDAISQ